MKPLVKRLCFYGALLFLPCVWIGSEVLYAVHIRPTGVHTVADHVRRFGEPQFVYEVVRDGRTYYEFTGFSPAAPPLLAVPSSAAAYIYDQKGQFTDWCSDPGDSPAYRQAWPRVPDMRLDIQTVRERISK